MKILTKKRTPFVIFLVIFGILVYLFFTNTRGIVKEKQETGPSELKTYRNEKIGFEFQYPVNWETKESPYGSPSGKFDIEVRPIIRSAKEEYSTFIFISIVTPDYINKIEGIKSSIVTSVNNIQGRKYINDYGMIFVAIPFEKEMIVLGASEQYENILNQIIATFNFFSPKKNASEPASELKSYKNEKFGFEFRYPSDWKIMENTFWSPVSKFNLIVVPVEGGYLPDPVFVNITTPEFANRAFLDLEDKATEVNIGGVKGKRYEYEFESLNQISIHLPFDEYHILLGAKKAYEDIFNQVLSSLKFLK